MRGRNCCKVIDLIFTDWQLWEPLFRSGGVRLSSDLQRLVPSGHQPLQAGAAQHCAQVGSHVQATPHWTCDQQVPSIIALRPLCYTGYQLWTVFYVELIDDLYTPTYTVYQIQVPLTHSLIAILGNRNTDELEPSPRSFFYALDVQ